MATEDSAIDVVFAPSLGAVLSNKALGLLPHRIFSSVSRHFGMRHISCHCRMPHLQRWKYCDLDPALDEARRLVLGFHA